jgi:hypothetical protein
MRARRAALALVLVFGASEARAEDTKKEAAALFNQALKQSASGDARSALASFRAAYEKFPNFRVLYNIGRVCSGLGDNACAVRAYEQYLQDGAGDVPAKRRKEVEAELATLGKSIGSLTITSNVEGADVSVDDANVGKTPVAAPVKVNAGNHTVVLVHEGKKAERSVGIAAGETATVDLQIALEPPPAPAAPPPEAPPPAPEPPPAPKEPEERHVPILPWAITGGAALVTIVTGALAAGAYSDFQDAKDRFGVTRSELDDAQGSARTMFLVTGVFATITIASAAVASYMTWLSPRTQVRVGPSGVFLAGALP